MTIKELIKQSHQLAIDKGFWEYDPRFAHSGKEGEKVYIKERNISELLMLIVSELGEACEALREGNRQEYLKELGNEEILSQWVKDSFEDEIADAVIRIADLCGALDIDLEWQIKKKLEYNKTRPYKHGKKF